MADAPQTVKPQTKPLAPIALKNVAGFFTLVTTLQRRMPGMPNIGVMYGHSGYGKSYASIYAENKTGAIRVEMGEKWTAGDLCRAILLEGGVGNPKGRTARLVEQVNDILGESRERPLIIDEADRLISRNVVEVVRDFADKSQAPVLLIGEEMFPSKLQAVERVHNRVLSWYGAIPSDLEDAKKLAQAVAPGVVFADDLVDMFRVKGEGRARRIVNSLHYAAEWARNANVKELSLANYQGGVFTGDAPQPRSAKKLFGRAA
jgi:DNA transposition AAA+ family ATPase